MNTYEKCFLVLLFLTSSLLAQGLKWEPLGPNGDGGFVFAIDPHDNNTIFAATKGFKGPSLIFKAVNNNWEYYSTMPGETDQLVIGKKITTGLQALQEKGFSKVPIKE